MITGGYNFFLGMQNSPEYERDVAHMRSAIRRQDLDGIIVPFIQQTADALVRQSGGSIDIVKQLSRVVPARLIAEYFGCVPPSNRELADWGTAIFQFLFTGLLKDPAVGQAARNAAAKARSWLTIRGQRIDARRNDSEGDHGGSRNTVGHAR